jgi:hypothetical protein
VVHEQPRTVAGLAVAPWTTADADAGPALRVAPGWADRVMLGLDRLQTADIQGAVAARAADVTGATAGPPASATVDPLVPLRRRLHRLALAGVRSLPLAATAEVTRERALFERRLMPGASQALGALLRAAREREAGAGSGLARAWVAAAEYERGARLAIEREAWRAVAFPSLSARNVTSPLGEGVPSASTAGG